MGRRKAPQGRDRKIPPRPKASSPRNNESRKSSWRCAKEAWNDLRTFHGDADKQHHFTWKFLPPVSNTLSVSALPPVSFIRGVGGSPSHFRTPIRDLSLTKQQYTLLTRMMYILSSFGIKYRRLPSKNNLPGMLRTCAAKITQLGFSCGLATSRTSRLGS